MILQSAKLGRLEVDDNPIASGGAGTVHLVRNGVESSRHCVKILSKPKPKDFEKIRHMCENVPLSTSGGWGMLCWPIDIVGPRRGSETGFVMPMALPGSVDFSHLTNIRWPGRSSSRLASVLQRTEAQGMAKRMLVGCNLAAAVAKVHELGTVFIDLKPANILVDPTGKISLVDLDSLQVKTGRTLYPGPLGSPEYMPAESYKLDFSTQPVIDKSWDNFSLAVVLYELLLGIHPYTASVKPTVMGCETIQDSIRFKLYVHGANKSNLDVIPPPHNALTQLPQEIADLFRRAFDSNRPSDRPSAKEWGESLHKAAKSPAQGLPRNVYQQPAPPIQTRRRVQPQSHVSPQPAGSFQSTSTCWGPPPPVGGVCPYGGARRGLPNWSNSTGTPVYICPDCLQKGVATEKCWGPIGGGVCPHSPRRAGAPNIKNPHGVKVYICPDCQSRSPGGAYVGSKCWGPIGGGACQHQSHGTPNYDIGGSQRVYICPNCMASAKPNKEEKQNTIVYTVICILLMFSLLKRCG